MKKILVVFTIMLLAPRCLAAEITPDQWVRATVGKFTLLLKADRDVDAEDPRRLYAMMDFCEQVLPHIDFRAMSRFALGRYWREATQDQRARFTHEFRNLLVRTYGTALRKYSERQVIYLPFSGAPGDKTAVVKTVVKPAGGGPDIPINYSFYKVHSVWKLYDIAIDGVSLVSTYHDTYADLIKKKGIDALITGITASNKDPPSRLEWYLLKPKCRAG
jgi:phospholipid transport system substrate-binding protein